MELTNNQFSHYLSITEIYHETIKRKIKTDYQRRVGSRNGRGYRPKSGKPAPDLPFFKRKRQAMTDEEADAKRTETVADISSSLKAQLGDRLKTVKIGGDDAESLVQAIKEIDPTADVEVFDK